ncbi:MAG: VirC2 family conjugal transfer protein [Rhodobacterales bacterium]|nr:VirC2 family conjugal transfer protein [Rhodobacterales bacterium]
MALKRLPKDLTFEAVRNLPSPFAKGSPKSLDAAEDESPTLKDKNNPSPPPSEPETREQLPETVTEKESAKLDTPASVEKPPAKPPVQPLATPPPTTSRNEGETVQMKARIAPPADGVSELFDSVKSAYDEKTAFKHLINVALKSYEDALLSGDKRAEKEQPSFASHPPSKAVYPSRVVSRAFYDAATAVIDPLGILAPSAFGTAVMRNAIGWYVDQHPPKN